jgi:predicted transcriptional regulator
VTKTPQDLTGMTAEIVSSYVRANAVEIAEVPGLIESVYSALRTLQSRGEEPPPNDVTPAIAPKKSVTPDFLICLEDGKRFKSLKRHLRTRYNMTPEQYRTKWGLPHDYPMVAPNYARARSDLAKRMGLGQPNKKDE